MRSVKAEAAAKSRLEALPASISPGYQKTSMRSSSSKGETNYAVRLKVEDDIRAACA